MMKTTADYLDALRERFRVPSDYGLQTATGWQRQQISRYRTRRGTFDDETAQRVAAWLDIPLSAVLIDMNAQRAKRPEVKKAWETIARASAIAAMLLISIVIYYAPGVDLEVISAGFMLAGNTHYTKLYKARQRVIKSLTGLLDSVFNPCLTQHRLDFLVAASYCKT